MHKDILEIERSDAEIKRLREELEAVRRETQTYKYELAIKAKMCQALKKEMGEEMNASQAKYKDQIHVLKDEIERAMVDLQHSYELLE
ncbi:hypothetical protein ACOSQ2_007027 [Xanthoceras sorbifolium]